MLFKTATSRNIFAVVTCGLVTTVAAAGILFSVSYEQIKATSLHSMEEMAKAQANDISTTFALGTNIGRNLGTALAGMKAADDQTRDKADRLMHDLLQDNPMALGVWSGWDENAFDGKDKDFAGKPGYDATGRYMPYWVRSDGNIIHEVLVDYTVPGAGDYYIKPHDSQKPVVIEPYIYPVGGKDVLMTTLSGPIVIDGKVVGVSGIDMALSELNAKLSALKPFGDGSVSLVSQAGIIVSHPDAAIIGKNLSDSGLDASAWQNMIANTGKPFEMASADGSTTLAMAVPVQILPDVQWYAIIAVPKATLFADLNRTAWIAGAIVLAAAILLMLAGAMISRGFRNRILRIIGETAAIANGNFSVALTDARKADELGDLARSLEILRDSNAERQKLQEEARHASDQRAADREAQNAERNRQEAEIQFVIKQLGEGLNHLAGGDLTFQLSTPFSGSFESLRADFNRSVESLQSTLQSFAHNASTIDAASSEIRHAANELAKRTEQQAASVEQTAAALEEITTSVKDSTKRAENVGEMVNRTKDGAEKSGLVVSNAVAAMSAIEKSSHEISNIIGVIDEIAFQTNLLALNAGVEAARAGDAGKGFAVVAQEVRELAQRSASAAKEIKSLITSSGDQVKNGVTLVGQAGSALQTIAAEVQVINSHIAEIITAAREQSNGLAEINTAVNQIDQGTQQNAAMVEESNAASHSLANEASALTERLGSFKLADRPAAARPAPARTTAAPARPVAVTRDQRPQPSRPAQNSVASMINRVSSTFSRKPASNAAVATDQSWEEF